MRRDLAVNLHIRACARRAVRGALISSTTKNCIFASKPTIQSDKFDETRVGVMLKLLHDSYEGRQAVHRLC